MDGPWATWESPTAPTSVTIGVLDGVHRGHRALIDRLDASMMRTVLTFDPHPVEVLRPGTPPRLITTIDERVDLLADIGVELVGILDLSEIKEQSPEEFVEGVLVGKLGAEHLVVGVDFRFGKDRSGDVELLDRLGPQLGLTMETIGLVAEEGSPVSSSRVRLLIEEGRVAEAASYLERWYAVTAKVVHGDERGRQIGYPTANVRPPSRKVVPGTGVYACFASVGEDRHDAAVNVGVRPTFGGGELLIEAHLLDFDDDVYGRELTIEFVDYLRPELKFDGVGELVERMDDDVSRATGILSRARARI
ncbi:MAG TPA: bifunctional riboflavin kinase/FAD synthetase [Acidimicrobiia bacterium]|nr:bifunctional riboflavin kinase/FAD synthetase [Acidimicrobiia bacterium]